MDITLVGLQHQFGENRVLNDINLEIHDGEFFTLLGPSGCGKTTLLRIIAGFIAPTSGRVMIGGEDMTQLAPEKRNIGTVFQNYALFPHLNVEENVQYGLKLRKLKRGDLEERVDTYLNLVGMYTYRKRKITELSGGQQQRVALARSLAIEPKVLLLDEPMSNLDAALREKTRYEILSLQQRLKITTLFITHDQREAVSISDRVAVINGGRVLQIGTPQEVYRNPSDRFSANFLGESNEFTEEELRRLGADMQCGPDAGSFLRPERLLITAPTASGTGMSGVIEKATFNGSTVDYTVRAEGRVLKVTELNSGSNSDLRAVGSAVRITVERGVPTETGGTNHDR